MRNFQQTFVFAVVTILLCGCSHKEIKEASYDIIPKPMSVEMPNSGEFFTLNKNTVITYTSGNEALESNADYLQGIIEHLTGLKLKISSETKEENAIVLKDNADISNPEGYELRVEPKVISINGSTAAGNFYGIQTLIKSLPLKSKGNVRFPEVTILDEPRFAYRGAHFDVARHFFPADSVKSFIDMIALHNINRFHWHLSDDQGWRIEIKSRPLLTELGSKRKGTVIGRNTGKYDSIPVEGFYSQEEIRDIIDYAAKRHITIIPEIDLPGHMQAALNAYPELGCFNEKYDVWEQWGVSENVLCAGKEETVKFLEDVLGEVADLFPGELVHIGGDECPKEHWEECVTCQLKIRELGLKTDENGTKESKLQSYIMKRASDFLESKGKRIIGWDEILEGGMSEDVIVMSWRGEAGGIEASKKGHDVIMTPNNYMYFDYYQTLDKEDEPLAIGGYVPLEKVYSYEPVPSELNEEEGKHILGVQANLWTEYISSMDHVRYMELPRLAALSEVQWSNHPKDYKDFVKRLPGMFKHYDANGYRYSTHVYDITGKSRSNPLDRNIEYTLSMADEIPIYYTTDGSEPGLQSMIYSEPLKLNESAVIKAVTFPQGEIGKLFTDSVTINKATWKKVTISTPPHPSYREGAPDILTDGCFGGNAVAPGEWLGFNSNEIIMEIDLGEKEEISSVTIRTLTVTGSWIFDMRGIHIETSLDGRDWQTVAMEKYPALDKDYNTILTHKVTFTEKEAQFLRLIIDVEKEIPSWHDAAGNHAFVFIDEIIVD